LPVTWAFGARDDVVATPHVLADSADRSEVPSSSLAELSGLLWREREVLDQLHALLQAGADEVDTDGLLHSISSLELHRAITAREAAVELGLEGEPSLRDLIELSDKEWAAVLSGHRDALRALSDEVRMLLRRVPANAIEGNVVTMPAPGTGRTVQRSLRDFLR
jgi:hypothetical protein